MATAEEEARNEKLRMERLGELHEMLWNDAELGAKVQKIAKQKWPEIQTNAERFAPVMNPLLEAAEALKKDNAELRERMETRDREREERQTKRSLEKALDDAAKRFGLTSEGFDQMVARMKATNNFTDAEAAAAWVAQTAPPKPVDGPTWGDKPMDMFGAGKFDENMKALHRDPQKYMDDQLSEFVQNPDKYVRDTLGVQ